MAKERATRVTLQVSLFAAQARQLAGRLRMPGRACGAPRCERASPDGAWKAAVLDAVRPEDGATASQILIADADATGFDPQAPLAVFDARVEGIEWSGPDLLVAFPAQAQFAAYSLYPGLRYFHSPGPSGGAPGVRWIRLSIRRRRR